MRISMLIFLSILIFYPPYARGLFFTKELLPFHIMSFGLFLVFVIYKFIIKDYVIFKAPIDYAAAGLVVAYFLPIMFSQTALIRDAISELLKYINYFVTYLIIRDIVKSRRELLILVNVMLASAIGMALIGIDAGAGEKLARVIERVVSILPGVEYRIFGTISAGGRINSMIQYSNTLAAYLMAAFMLSNGLLLYVKNRTIKHLYAGASFILLLTFVFTYSRGAWLLMPIAYLVFLVMLRKVHIIMEALFYGGAVGLVVLPAIPLFYKYLEADSARGVWMVTFGGAIAATILSFIIGFLIELLKKISTKKLLIVGVIGVGLLVAAAGTLLGVALRVEAPVEFINDTESNRWRTIDKVVDGIQGDREYTLQYAVDTAHSEANENHWAYQVIVSSIDAMNEQETILQFNDLEIEEDGIITFTTLQETEKINIRIRNVYPSTAVTLQNAVLIDNESSEEQEVLFRYKYIPDSLVRRFNAINTEVSSVSARVAFYRDGVDMIKDYPIIGAGGGAWGAMYFMYQSYMYWSTQTHNYFMQLWIEVGTLGLLILIAFIVLFLFALYRYHRKVSKKETGIILVAAFTAGVFALLAHSVIDFDLALAAVSLMLWQLIVFAMILVNEKETFASKRYALITVGAIGVLVFFFSISLQSGYLNGQKGVKYVREQQIDKAIIYFEKAVRRDPFNASYHMDLGRIYQDTAMVESDGKRHVVDREQFDKAEDMVKRALKLEPYNSQLYAHAASFMMRRGQVDISLDYIERSIKVQPLRNQNYQQKAQAYFQLAVSYLNAQRYEEGEEKLREILEIPSVMREINKRIERPISLNVETVDMLEKADYLLRNYKEADGIDRFNRMVFNAYLDGDTIPRGIPDTWQVRSNAQAELATNITHNQALVIKNEGEGYVVVDTRRFNLMPDTKYILQINKSGNLESNNHLIIRVISTSGNTKQLHVGSVEIDNEVQLYQYEFETTNDIEGGQQYLRFDFRGSGEEYVEVLGAIIYKVKQE